MLLFFFTGRRNVFLMKIMALDYSLDPRHSTSLLARTSQEINFFLQIELAIEFDGAAKKMP